MRLCSWPWRWLPSSSKQIPCSGPSTPRYQHWSQGQPGTGLLHGQSETGWITLHTYPLCGDAVVPVPSAWGLGRELGDGDWCKKGSQSGKRRAFASFCLDCCDL